MRKPIIALAALTIVVASIGDATAQRRHHHHRGGNVAGAVAVGVVGGALLGAAIASQPVQAAPRGCVAEREYWSDRRQAYVIKRERVPC